MEQHLIASRIKGLRRKKGINQIELAELIGVSRQTITRWETGLRNPDSESLAKIAKVLQTTVSYLMGEAEQPHPIYDEHSNVKGPMQDAILLPVLSAEITACCGDGIPLLDLTSKASRFVPFPKSWIRVYDDLRPPFVIDAEGDSMAGYGIPDRSLVAVNPAEDMRSGHIAVVCIGDQIAIKKIYFRPTGIELRSADNRSPIFISPEEQECGWFKVMGKVLGALSGVDENP